MTDAPDARSDDDDVAQLVHALRQGLSTLLLLVDRAQRADVPAEAAQVVELIGQQVNELVAVARGIGRSVE